MVEIRRMGPQIGVEVTGVDVKALDDAGFARIYHAWLDYNILVVRDQELEIRDFLRYSRRFGPVVPHPSKSTRHPEVPEITILGINKFDADGKLNNAIYRRGAEGWHTDGAYNQAPFKATQLYAVAVPSRGGDTLFANAYAAYDALPERLKHRLEGVKGAFSYGGRRLSARGRSHSLAGIDQRLRRRGPRGGRIAPVVVEVLAVQRPRWARADGPPRRHTPSAYPDRRPMGDGRCCRLAIIDNGKVARIVR